MDSIYQKKKALEEYLLSLGSVAIAFSSGVDSTFLLKVAHDLLGDGAIALTVHSKSFPGRESKEADAFCEREGIRHEIVNVEELSIPGYADNPPNRCYLCKKELFQSMIKRAQELGFSHVAEGSNVDDEGDYRPGLLAIQELQVKSPLRKAKLTKEEIRILSKELNLPTWNKPSFACLATRFPYGERITEEKLSMVEEAEQELFDLGFEQFRVRIHGNIARIEVKPDAFGKVLQSNVAARLNAKLQQVGFRFVTLDLGGYVMGNLNKDLHLDKGAGQ